MEHLNDYDSFVWYKERAIQREITERMQAFSGRVVEVVQNEEFIRKIKVQIHCVQLSKMKPRDWEKFYAKKFDAMWSMGQWEKLWEDAFLFVLYNK